METYIRMWGNSLALRIPKVMAEQVGLEEDVRVDLVMEGDHLLIKPSVPRYALEDLLAQVTPENLHAEVTTGEPLGNEVW